MTNTITKKQLTGKKDLFGLYFQVTVHHHGKSWQVLKQDLEADIMEEGCLLSESPSASFLI